MVENVANIDIVEDISALDFNQHAKLMLALQEQAEKFPDAANSLLPNFYRLLEGKGASLDMLPTAADIFSSISKHLSQAQIAEAIQTMHNLGKGNFIERGAGIIVKQNPRCAEPIFNYIVSQLEKTPYSDDKKNFFMPAIRNMALAIVCADDDKKLQMLSKVDSFEDAIQDIFYLNYAKQLVNQNTIKCDVLMDKLKDYEIRKSSNYAQIYQNIGVIVNMDKSKIDECLHFISTTIGGSKVDICDLKAAYEVLGQIRKVYPNKEKVDAIFMRGLQNPKNNLSTKRAAYRQMEKIDELKSHSTIGKRVKKTKDNEHGFVKADQIPEDETAILFLGGNATNSDRSANGYLSPLEDLLKHHKIEENIPLYAAIYDFGEYDDKAVAFNDNLARKKLMQDYHRNVEISKQLNEDTLYPRYVDELFDKTLLHRICDKNGKRLSAEEACAKIRKLTIVAHCHGAYTFLKLEEKMWAKMKELGYSDEERAKIQHELLCVAHAPYAPLGDSKSTMISFASAKDLEIRHYNNFEMEIRAMSRNNEVMLSYFPDKQGELFLVPSMGKDVEEHNFLGYLPENQRLSKEGLIIMALSGRAIVNSVKNSLSGKPLPSVKELICGSDKKYQKLFDKLKENGEKMWQKMSLNMAIRLKAVAEYNKLFKG